MHRVVGLQNRINQLSTQFTAKTEKKTKRQVPSRFLRTFRQPHRPALRYGYPSSRVTSR